MLRQGQPALSCDSELCVSKADQFLADKYTSNRVESMCVKKRAPDRKPELRAETDKGAARCINSFH